jgi:hypothetical protein
MSSGIPYLASIEKKIKKGSGVHSVFILLWIEGSLIL